MAATLEELKVTLDGIESAMQALLSNITIGGASVIVTDLSQISQALGLVVAGEFRTGTGTPGAGFNGVRMRWPPMTYGSSTWNIAGLSNDVLQFGLSATTGKAYAGAGAVLLDSNGVSILTGNLVLDPEKSLKFVTGSETDLFIGSYTAAGINYGLVDLGAADSDGTYQRDLLITSHGNNKIANLGLTATSGSWVSRINLQAWGDTSFCKIDVSTDYLYFLPGSGPVCHVDFSDARVVGRDGWIYSINAWTYASATSFTVAGDHTSKFPIGSKVKLTQTTVKYFTVVARSYSSPNTTVTVTGGSDYTVANAAITLPYYSYEETPQGFPDWFNWTPTLTGWSTDPTPAIYRFKVSGRKVTLMVRQAGAAGSNASDDTSIIITAPITAATITDMTWGTAMWSLRDNSVFLTTAGRATIASASANINCYSDMQSGAWTNANTKSVSFELEYEI